MKSKVVRSRLQTAGFYNLIVGYPRHEPEIWLPGYPFDFLSGRDDGQRLKGTSMGHVISYYQAPDSERTWQPKLFCKNRELLYEKYSSGMKSLTWESKLLYVHCNRSREAGTGRVKYIFGAETRQGQVQPGPLSPWRFTL